MASSSPRSQAHIRGSRHTSHLPSSSKDTDTRPHRCSSPRYASSAPESLLSRLEAVDRDAARRQFAFYGRQNAHVDHISDTDQEQQTGRAAALQSTLLLQENGELAALLDDVKYLLDGILEPVKTQRGLVGRARSVLELTKLLQDQQIQQVVGLPSQRSLQVRVKEVLQTRLGTTGEDCNGADEMYRVSLAVLAYFVSLSSDAEEYFGEKALDALVRALKNAVARESRYEEVGDVEDKRRVDTDVEGSLAMPRRKTCLKRKQTRVSSSQKQLEDDTVSMATPCGEKNGVFALDGEEASLSTGVVKGSQLPRSTYSVVTDELWQMQLDELLHDHELFVVEGELRVSAAVVLYAALHNLVQVDSLSASPASSVDVAQRYQQRSSGRPGDVVEDTLQSIRARKRQLVRNGGLDVIMRDLDKRLSILHELLPTTLAEPVSLKCARTLHSMKMLLSVLDQVSFLIVDVQQYLSKCEDLFGLLLKVIRLLADLGWGEKALKRWESESSRLTLAVEALVTALRVLINLTHHNTEAARHVYALGGMQLLPYSFSHLVYTTSELKKSPQLSEVLDKWEFDTCLLLLSAMANSVEFSNDNRDALADASLPMEALSTMSSQTERVGIRPCELFTRFFLAKVQSYAHLIASHDTQDAIEAESGDWHPEDIILGGCASLLLGYLMKGSSINSASILKYLPDGSPRLLLRALGVFVAFHSQIGALTPEVVESVLHIEKVFKSCLRSEGRTDLLTGIIPDSSLGVLSQTEQNQQDAPRIDQLSAPILSVDESQDNYPHRPTVSLRTQSVKNVCSNIDDSDQENEPHLNCKGTSTRKEYLSLRGRRASGMSTPTRSPQQSPPRSQVTVKSKSPCRVKRSPLIAVQPDGTLSSPVVARLLKRTRQLVDEFDAEFAKQCRPLRGGNRRLAPIENESSSRVVLTMDVTCQDSGGDGLDICQDIAADDNSITTKELDDAQLPPFKRRKKCLQKTEVGSAIEKDCSHTFENQLDVFDFVVEDIQPSTPQRKKENDSVLQTPTRTMRSSAVAGQSPLVNLTPTKKSPTMPPLPMKAPMELLQTPTRNGRSSIMNQSPMSASPLRRAKTARTSPAARSSAVFDFTD